MIGGQRKTRRRVMKEMLGMMDELFYQPVVTTTHDSIITTSTTTTTTSSFVVVRGTTTLSTTFSHRFSHEAFKRFEILTSELDKSPLWNVELSSYQHFLDNSDGTSKNC